MTVAAPSRSARLFAVRKAVTKRPVRPPDADIADIILADTARHGGESSLMAVWARLIRERIAGLK